MGFWDEGLNKDLNSREFMNKLTFCFPQQISRETELVIITLAKSYLEKSILCAEVRIL